MTAANHTVTGMVIAAAVKNPLLAVPLAIASHFVLDAIPHFGNHSIIHKKIKVFSIYLVADMAVALSLLISVLLLAPPDAWLIVICGILGASPDLMWIPDYLAMLSGKHEPKKGAIKRFHSKLQKEYPSGLILEAIWFLTMCGLLLWLMRPA